jgi:hypothetical protein
LALARLGHLDATVPVSSAPAVTASKVSAPGASVAAGRNKVALKSVTPALATESAGAQLSGQKRSRKER